MSGVFLQRRLSSTGEGAALILDASRMASGHTLISFAEGVDPDRLELPGGARIVEPREIGGATQLVCEGLGDDATLRIDGDPVTLSVVADDLAAFAGTNALLGVRNGESAGIVLDWLRFHATHHGASAAVILDRAKPGTDPGFAAALEAGLSGIRGLQAVAVVSCDHPLGKPDHPAEAHPLSVAEAPGKDRIEVPGPSPWDAPLGAPTIYEILRHRFLNDARAVAHLDVHDLLMRIDGPTAFDHAVDSPTGLVQMMGRHCFPWRVRPKTDPQFGDHVCIQFDTPAGRRRWCIAPGKAPAEAVWRMVRIAGGNPDRGRLINFYRHMALRHPTEQVGQIVPKTSLIEHEPLIAQARDIWDHAPVRMPEVKAQPVAKTNGRRAIITCMKNEGPFILEWLAYHRAIGFDDVLVYTNDCTDGTDTMLNLLQDKGLVQHRDNPFRKMDMKPQHAALQSADDEPVIRDAEWVASIDVDEFVNIKIGDGTLDALFGAVPDANMIAMTWRLFGNADVHEYRDDFLMRQFIRCAPELCRKPHQAWGFKTLFQNIGLFKKLGVHRPKGLNPQLWDKIRWVNGSGRPLPRQMFRNGWRSTVGTFGYDLVQLNHYAVRSAESFLVKRDRGRVNHVDRDQGLAYWFRMNNNAEEETSIQARIPMMQVEYDRLMDDPLIAAAHAHSVAQHRAKIDELKSGDNYARFYADLTGARMEKLSRMHTHFGANVFLAGPDAIPDEIVARNPDEDFYFTVERGETAH